MPLSGMCSASGILTQQPSSSSLASLTCCYCIVITRNIVATYMYTTNCEAILNLALQYSHTV